MGTGGALIRARNLLGSAFMVLYGDSYLAINYREIADYFLKEDELALMTLMKNDLNAEVSNVVFEEGFVKKYDKNAYEASMEYIDFGLNIFKTEVFSNYPLNQKIDLSTIQSELATRGQMIGYQVNQRYYEVGSFKGLQDFKDFVEGL